MSKIGWILQAGVETEQCRLCDWKILKLMELMENYQNMSTEGGRGGNQLLLPSKSRRQKVFCAPKHAISHLSYKVKKYC